MALRLVAPAPDDADERPSAEDDAVERTRASLARLRLDANEFFRFPVFPLHKLCGALAPSELCIIGAAPGNGKSLLAHNIVRWALAQGVSTYVFGTEQDAGVLGIKQACINCRVPFKLILKPEPHEKDTTEYQDAMQRVRAEIKRLELEAHMLWYSKEEMISRAVLERDVHKAVRDNGARLILLDHIHHMQHGSGQNPISELTETVHAFKNLCKRHGVVGIAFAQLKRGVGITRYEPPAMEDLAGAAALERTADVILGLWRPLRLDLTRDDIKKLKKEAREGGRAKPEIYEPSCMGVKLLKDRLGDVFDKTELLRIDRGRLEEMLERDRYSASYDGLRTI